MGALDGGGGGGGGVFFCFDAAQAAVEIKGGAGGRLLRLLGAEGSRRGEGGAGFKGKGFLAFEHNSRLYVKIFID